MCIAEMRDVRCDPVSLLRSDAAASSERRFNTASSLRPAGVSVTRRTRASLVDAKLRIKPSASSPRSSRLA